MDEHFTPEELARFKASFEPALLEEAKKHGDGPEIGVTVELKSASLQKRSPYITMTVFLWDAATRKPMGHYYTGTQPNLANVETKFAPLQPNTMIREKTYYQKEVANPMDALANGAVSSIMYKLYPPVN